MPVSTCTKCQQLYDAGSEEQANEPDRICLACAMARSKPAVYLVLLACVMDDIPAGVWASPDDARRQAVTIAADPEPALAASCTGNGSAPMAVHVLECRGAVLELLETLDIETKETTE